MKLVKWTAWTCSTHDIIGDISWLLSSERATKGHMHMKTRLLFQISKTVSKNINESCEIFYSYGWVMQRASTAKKCCLRRIGTLWLRRAFVMLPQKMISVPYWKKKSHLIFENATTSADNDGNSWRELKGHSEIFDVQNVQLIEVQSRVNFLDTHIYSKEQARSTWGKHLCYWPHDCSWPTVRSLPASAASDSMSSQSGDGVWSAFACTHQQEHVRPSTFILIRYKISTKLAWVKCPTQSNICVLLELWMRLYKMVYESKQAPVIIFNFDDIIRWSTT